MKKATFKYTTPSTASIYGVITQSDEGKISVSLINAKGFMYRDKFSAKKLAQEIVDADFKHKAVTGLTVSNVEKLIEILKKETATLKEQFLTYTEKYAKEYFEICVQNSKRTESEWYDAFGVKYKMTDSYGTKMAIPDSKEYNGKTLYRMRNVRDEQNGIVRAGLNAHVERELKWAEIHYNDSIAKLAHRIEQKGLDQSKLTAHTSHIGLNINTTLTDGVQTVKAFTIIAQGPIQRPHYRYLIK